MNQTTQTCNIRSETPADYHAVTETHMSAFTYHPYTSEGLLTAMLRMRAGHDPEFSLVAEMGGEIVGHVLFTPMVLRIREVDVPSLLLAPLGVRPKYHNQGIGKLLVEEGQRIAREKGYACSFLLGHSAYYPRFGYKTNMFGNCQVRVQLSDLPSNTATLTEKRVEQADIPYFLTLWERWYGSSDCVLVPGQSLTDWLSITKLVHTASIWQGDELIGYVRYCADNSGRILMFLAKDDQASATILAYLGQLPVLVSPDGYLQVSLPTSSATNRLPVPYTCVNERWDAAMICVLDESNTAVQSYIEGVSNNVIQPGPMIWPVEFDTDI